MRKIVVMVMALIVSVTLSAAAFAGPMVKEITFYGNAQQGSIGDGTRGYSWYHSNANPGDPVVIKNLINCSNKVAVRDTACHSNHKAEKKRICSERKEIAPCKYNGVQICPNKHFHQRGEWLYYIDDNGVKHHFYLDPDLEYEWHHYKDKDGVTQYYYEITGCKI